ncbi:MAG: hypothetical protein PHP59_03665 [Methanofollis sp.]|uniref:hypothetical protein n=1 Tax=Methanofollis sp. TaxID=2052835 RepID=UPI00263A1ACA|nr:hypothetical protein [Methanofollis sp.]MDD4254453.1 hypothetical protein [Methanofollis sp.]
MGLDPASALPMAWSAALYDGGPVREFIDALDLSPAYGLLKECEEVCPWYGEVVQNGRHMIACLLGQALDRAGEPCRVVVPAAGMNPLALEVLERYPDQVSSVVEVGRAGMEEKHALYARVAPDLAARISCVQADIASVLSLPFAVGEPTVLVLEGASYYPDRATLAGILGSFYSGTGKNHVIAEYLAPCQMVALRRRAVPRAVLSCLKERSGLPVISLYTPGMIESLIRDAGGRVEAHYSMAAMERLRCGENHFFRSDEDGRIWCTVGRL